MKITWEYEGKRYVISGHKNGQMYLNKYPCDECDDILKGLSSHDEHTRAIAKGKAKRLYAKLSERYDHPDIAFAEEFNKRQEQMRKQAKKDWERKQMKDDWFLYVIGIAIVGFFIYIAFKVWWFFVGYDAFEGPFADQYSAGEISADTIILFIVLIVVIEEVIRRIRNGHF